MRKCISCGHMTLLGICRFCYNPTVEIKPKIIDTKVIATKDTQKLEIEINKGLKEGFRLRGDLVVSDGFYTQLMVKIG